jgi:single-stranded-DNA-specific exonuclease
MAEAGLRLAHVDAVSIGFRLAPRLNAAGRIGTAMLAYELLTSSDALETKRLAEELGKLNQQRQQITEKTVAEATAQVLADDPDAYLYLAASRDFLPGVVGLAASRLTDAFHRPSVVVEVGDDVSRGSCRSIADFHITKALDQCGDLLVRHGGHAAAAGFTVATKNLDALHRRLQSLAADKLAGTDLRPLLLIDAEIPLEEVNWATHALLNRIEPCGVDNPRPVLLSRDLKVAARRTVGRETKHLKLVLRDERGASWDSIAFRKGDLLGHVPDRVDVAYVLDANEWNQKKRLQLVVQDLKAACPHATSA